MSGISSLLSRVQAADQRFYGVYEGIVTSVDDEAKEGRVKVRLPWYDNQTEFVCRVRQAYAGDQFGTFFIPEPTCEVLIAFVQGDMRFPVILGGLYNGVDKPPTYRADDKDEKMIRTKAGHQIVLDDTKGSEKIVIIDKDEKNKIVIDCTDDSITISSKTGTLNLEANEINIKSTADTNIQAGSSLNAKGTTINLN